MAEQYHLKHPFPCKQQPKDMPYKELLKQLTSQQHAILIDLGKPAVNVTRRWKPTHSENLKRPSELLSGLPLGLAVTIYC